MECLSAVTAESSAGTEVHKKVGVGEADRVGEASEGQQTFLVLSDRALMLVRWSLHPAGPSDSPKVKL